MNLPKIAPNCMTARVLLAFLATAGLYYVNIMPALVDGLKVGLGFTNRDAGLVGSANMYGAACGAFIVAFFIRRLNWRLFAHFFLFCLIAFDAISIFVTDPFGLMSVRFVHGFFGGALVGLGFSIMARTEAPDRTFGMLLLVQALAGGLGVMTLPLLVPHFGTQVLFITLILFSCITLLFLQFLPDYPHIAQDKQDLAQTSATRSRKPFLYALVAVFLFQAANMGLYAFIIGLGKSYSLELEFVSQSLGIANWVGVIGAVLVIWLSTRFGICKPILIGMVLTVVGTWALLHSDIKWVWVAANFVTAITWNFVIAYLLGMCARFDLSGQSAVWAGFASKMGLASGPMLGSFILTGSHYDALVWSAFAMLLLSAAAAWLPASTLDRESNLARRNQA